MIVDVRINLSKLTNDELGMLYDFCDCSPSSEEFNFKFFQCLEEEVKLRLSDGRMSRPVFGEGGPTDWELFVVDL